MRPLVILVLLVVCACSVRSEWDYTRANGRPLIIAHRGDASVFPENTLEAF